ncbi:MAG TPA: sel1 repeat family protein [Rudaea sp.]
MRKPTTARTLALAILLLAACGVHAEDDPLNDPGVQKTLRAMKNASTWYHPDQFGEFTGMRYYAHHQYKDALKYFELGAFYADKMSQLSMGLMYLNGEGTAKDPVTAYAWLDLAAERDYPDFVATRDRVKSELTPEQMRKAIAVRGRLAEKYADAVAKPRMEKQLKLGQMQLTGSRTGFDYGVSQVATKPDCGPAIVVGGEEVPSAGCGGASINSKSRWDPKEYFAARDAEYKATVSVGQLQTEGKPADKPPAQDAQKP